MLYQVMIRARARWGYTGYVIWEPFAGPTRDPFDALRLVRQASQRRAEALVVQAEDADDLAELVRHMRCEPLPQAAVVEVAEPAPVQADGQLDRQSLADELLAAWDTQRWELEQGSGGDHDTPYRFTLPTHTAELHHWLRMMMRYRGGDFGDYGS